MSMQQFLNQFKNAVRVSAPLVAVHTPDPASTIAVLCKNLKPDNSGAPRQTTQWDAIRTFTSTPLGGKLADTLAQAAETQMNPIGFVDLLGKKDLVPQQAVVFMHLADRWWNDHANGAGVVQGIWNLRDKFKANGRMLVMLTSSDQLPAELKNDVVLLNEPLPDSDRLTEVVKALEKSGKQGFAGFKCDDAARDKAVIRMSGLSTFAAEQAGAMSLRPDGFDLDDLWSRKVTTIEQTQGLAVDRGGESFATIGGLSQACKFGKRLFEGPEPPSVVVRVEEVEKVMAGAAGDMSGTSQDALQVLLNSMQDNNWTGMIAYGPPGSGKSEFSKSLAASFGTMSMSLDLNACKGSLVGQSEAQVREAIKTILAVGGQKVFFVATCNKTNLPPELLARFRCGTWIFDAPSPSEQDAIWKIKLAKFGLKANAKRPNDNRLMGRDIHNCCEMAKRLAFSPAEAYEFIAPLHKASPKIIEDARANAVGRFLSASYAGLYKMPEEDAAIRQVDLS